MGKILLIITMLYLFATLIISGKNLYSIKKVKVIMIIISIMISLSNYAFYFVDNNPLCLVNCFIFVINTTIIYNKK